MTSSPEEHPAVNKFRQYLQINTEQPNPAYYDCKLFLLEYAKELDLPSWSYECVAGKPIVGMTLEGSDPSLPSLFLWSHTDVTATVPEAWTHPPFSAYKDDQGNIFARGSQDMKSVGIQYMEAIRQLRQSGKKNFLRTVHIVFGPDEEIGSHDGMERYVHTQHFKQLNVGFALDEGLASPTSTYRVFIGQRCTWSRNRMIGSICGLNFLKVVELGVDRSAFIADILTSDTGNVSVFSPLGQHTMRFKVVCPGTRGHGSRMLANTAGPKLAALLQSFCEFREKQLKLLETNPQLTLSDITSINLTKVEGGDLTNLIPSEFIAYFDLRVARSDNIDEVEDMLVEWCKKAGTDVSYEFKHVGIPAIGFSPIDNHPLVSGWHTHDEFLNQATFLRGIQLYVKIIERLANVAAQ